MEPLRHGIRRYAEDIDSLIERGQQLHEALAHTYWPEEFKLEIMASRNLDETAFEQYVKSLPSFDIQYQSWYSEARALVRQLLPDREADFIEYYERPKSRKEVTFANYSIRDALEGVRMTRTLDRSEIVGPSAAAPRLVQQVSIVVAVRRRLESSLFDIRQMVQADLFDSELDAAVELIRNGFVRAAGAMAGVVLERHLRAVCASHSISVRKKRPSIGDFNEALKKAEVVDVPQWRFIQHLSDLRNLCDHDREVDPTAEQAKELVGGVAKIARTVF